jgi:Carboxypeptidase regulatory-like domain/TonB dependent receptor
MRGSIRLAILLAILSPAALAFAQDQNGTLRGVVFDPQGRVVSDAPVKTINESTGFSADGRTSIAGVYIFPNLLPGSYTVRVAAPGFAAYVRTGVQVFAAQVADVTATLTLGAATTQVIVVSGADVVQTESSQLGGAFQDRAISDIPVISGANLSVLNLSVFLPNTTTAPGGTSGTGGSIGGLRGRQNNFSIDGMDNNDPTVTTSSQPVILDAVQQFTVNQNVFNAEYGLGSGGQFNVITKAGTNQLHFDAWLYNMNRAYNAADNLEKAAIASGVMTGKHRFDFNRSGADIGGALIPNKFFMYGAYEFNNMGTEVSQVGLAPTAQGVSMLTAAAVDSQAKALLAQFPAAPAQNPCPGPPACTVTVNGQAIPVGSINAAAPSFVNDNNYIINSDLVLGAHSLHARFLADRNRQPTFGTFPQAQFASPSGIDNHRAIFSDVWTVTPSVLNEFSASYSRFSQFLPLNGIAASYPVLFINDLGGLTIGPNLSLPQSRLFNEYVLSDSAAWNTGRHALKFGGQYIWYTAPSSQSLQYPRGEYFYLSTSQLVNDQVPTFGFYGVGNGYFAGNSHGFNLFAQDDIKVTSRLIVNIGLRYDFSGNPADAKLNALNSIADLPGTPLVFHVPRQDWNNVGPRLGFAWDPTGSGKWSVRAGGGVIYDRIPWNFYSNGLPIEIQALLGSSPVSACTGTFGAPPVWCTSGSGFLANGGMNVNFVPPTTTAAARAQTTQMMADATSPKVFTWSLEAQHELYRGTSLTVRYLGTRGLELPVQIQLNSITPFEKGAQPLPTYIHATDIPAVVPASAPTLAQFNSLSGLRYAAQGFTGGPATLALAEGASTYHGGSVELLHRFDHGLFLRANYTFSKAMDNSTNDLATSLVDPRRPQDAYNLSSEWARSVMDMPHKVALTFIYDTPKVGWDNQLARAALNGWSLSGDYLFESGQPVTIQSGVDSNGNGDSAADRVILNPTGTEGLGSLVTPVCRDAVTGATSVNALCPSARTVGYTAVNPNAKYIEAGVGAVSTLGRNTFRSPYFNVWNMALSRSVHPTERLGMQFRVEAYNVFNHPNYTMGNLSVFSASTNANNPGYASLTGVASGAFLNPTIFSDNSRRLELVLKITY